MLVLPLWTLSAYKLAKVLITPRVRGTNNVKNADLIIYNNLALLVDFEAHHNQKGQKSKQLVFESS
jgi:hypothetical protein